MVTENSPLEELEIKYEKLKAIFLNECDKQDTIEEKAANYYIRAMLFETAKVLHDFYKDKNNEEKAKYWSDEMDFLEYKGSNEKELLEYMDSNPEKVADVVFLKLTRNT